MQLKSGTLLQNGKYRIVRFINSGGFGCTYEAIHTMFDEKVAIKEFFVKDFCNRDAQTRHVTVGTHSKKALVERLKVKFIEEAKSIRKLRHNGVVRVNDVFEENGTAYYVMDYIEGESLKEKVEARGHLTESEAIRYIRQVSDTLGYVHSKNILHLDIKPGNIMIDRDDNVILIDFGTSKQYDEVDGENTSTLMGKTPGYAPLEQMDNSVREFYPATDIYALGATLYKMLSGITPPNAIQRVTGTKMESMPSTISQRTKKAIELSMRILKDDRPQSVEEFLNILDGDKESRDYALSKAEKTNADELTDIDVIVQISDEINGHEYVDLGLPSGLKWATCNVGAKSPDDYGDYFAWGETEPKQVYNGDNYKHIYTKVESGFLGLSKRKMKCYKDIGVIISGTQYDAARANWGGSWRLPTKAELEELKNKCTWNWTTQNGVKGCKVTGPNGNSIFLPAAGYRYGSSLYYAGERGYYWSSTPDESDSSLAYYLYFSSSYQDVLWLSRNYGRSVRPVAE